MQTVLLFHKKHTIIRRYNYWKCHLFYFFYYFTWITCYRNIRYYLILPIRISFTSFQSRQNKQVFLHITMIRLYFILINYSSYLLNSHKWDFIPKAVTAFEIIFEHGIESTRHNRNIIIVKPRIPKYPYWLYIKWANTLRIGIIWMVVWSTKTPNTPVEILFIIFEQNRNFAKLMKKQ